MTADNTAAQVCREIAALMEVIQRDIDRIDAMLDDLPPADISVTLAVTDLQTGERTGIKFHDIDPAASFIRDLLNG